LTLVVVDETAELGATADLALRRPLPSLLDFGRSEFQGAMRPVAVVLVNADAEHAFEVTRRPRTSRRRLQAGVLKFRIKP